MSVTCHPKIQPIHGWLERSLVARHLREQLLDLLEQVVHLFMPSMYVSKTSLLVRQSSNGIYAGGISPTTIHIHLSTSGRAGEILNRNIAKTFPTPPAK